MKQFLLVLTSALLIVGCSKNTQLQTPLASSLCLIEGLVVNEDGAPVPDIHIIQSQQSKYHPGRPPRTSEDGRFFDDRAFLDRLYDIRPLGVEKNWKDSITLYFMDPKRVQGDPESGYAPQMFHLEVVFDHDKYPIYYYVLKEPLKVVMSRTCDNEEDFSWYHEEYVSERDLSWLEDEK